MKLLEVKNLSVHYFRKDRVIPALKGVTVSIESGKTLGIAGESGCGKSTLAHAILGLIAPHEGKIAGGEIWFEGRNIAALSAEELRKIRGKDIGMVFQDPFSSLNPVLTVGEQVGEAILAHAPATPQAAVRARVLELLAQVQLPDPERIRASYPHQISGGQRQRVMIAIAISNRPKLLIADEPTTALDVTVQKEILDLLAFLQRDMKMAILLITHHLGVIAAYTEDLAVFYAGEVAEEGKTAEVIRTPKHPYTQRLLSFARTGRRRGTKP